MSFLLVDYSKFLDQVFANLGSVGINISGFTIDHIAMRTDTPQDYQKFKAEYLSGNSLVGEIIIRNRPISVIRLASPLVYQDFQIPFFELMAPAADFAHPNGLEHAEVIVPDLDRFRVQYSGVEFDLKSRSRQINPELILRFPDHANVKFHIRSIDEAYRMQKEQGIL